MTGRLKKAVVRPVSYPYAVTHHHQVCPSAADMNCNDMVSDDIIPWRYSSELKKLFRKRMRGFSRRKKDL